MNCEGWVVRDEWWEMSGEGWVVRDGWWETSGERWVVGDECVCDVLYEMSEMSSVRCLCMWYVVWEMNEMSGVKWWWEMSDVRWIEMSGVRWVVWERLPRTTLTHSKAPNPHARKTSTQTFRTSYWRCYPEHSLHTASCQTRRPGRHQRKIFASHIGTATPNDAYTQQGAKPACQDDANVSHLLMALLPRTQFTHSKAPNPHARKTSPQYFRIS